MYNRYCNSKNPTRTLGNVFILMGVACFIIDIVMAANNEDPTKKTGGLMAFIAGTVSIVFGCIASPLLSHHLSRKNDQQKTPLLAAGMFTDTENGHKPSAKLNASELKV
ncbi:MAG: hypothetical protein V4496_04015 [Pseudomonadota bacterium]